MLLTTQYLEEADRFADAVHVLDDGVIIATGTAAQLKARTGAQVVESPSGVCSG
jgi:ABC-type multidrug transport system ATPase subunit